MTPDQPQPQPLSYHRPREQPIPLRKHLVFVPLLFWLGLFIVGMLLALLVILLSALGVFR